MLEIGIPCEVHTLSLGDYMWVAKRKKHVVDAEVRNVVIKDYIKQ